MCHAMGASLLFCLPAGQTKRPRRANVRDSGRHRGTCRAGAASRKQEAGSVMSARHPLPVSLAGGESVCSRWASGEREKVVQPVLEKSVFLRTGRCADIHWFWEFALRSKTTPPLLFCFLCFFHSAIVGKLSSHLPLISSPFPQQAEMKQKRRDDKRQRKNCQGSTKPNGRLQVTTLFPPLQGSSSNHIPSAPRPADLQVTTQTRARAPSVAQFTFRCPGWNMRDWRARKGGRGCVQKVGVSVRFGLSWLDLAGAHMSGVGDGRLKMMGRASQGPAGGAARLGYGADGCRPCGRERARAVRVGGLKGATSRNGFWGNDGRGLVGVSLDRMSLFFSLFFLACLSVCFLDACSLMRLCARVSSS
ncbi:hypothetical protein B0J18DRAFT_109664 [Chaetomium sp. MPI-SDFR-AT-0129]|nr:hypothetical protein B0J18DRAFT_109664 [Chaetomium sp. MPI-SDFR-AT-0129]